MMDWTGEHLIRTARPDAPKRPPSPQSLTAQKRIDDALYIEASRRGLSQSEAAEWLDVSAPSIWRAAKRLGLEFRDGRRNG